MKVFKVFQDALGLSAQTLVALVALVAVGLVAFGVGPGSTRVRPVVPSPTVGLMDTSAEIDLATVSVGPHSDLSRIGIPEQQGTLGTGTFAGPSTATGRSDFDIQPNSWVAVTCKVRGGDSQAGEYWYRVAAPPWNGTLYAPANTFWNADRAGAPPYDNPVDPTVPDC